MKKFLRSVREYRRANKMTQSELAEIVGTTQAAVSTIESGAANPQADTIEALADALGMDVVFIPKPLTPQVLALIRAFEHPAERFQDGRHLSAFDDVFAGDDGEEFAQEDRRREEAYRGPKP
ncbi:helix-turn-helix transcriptional regulator [Sinorhizobium sp. NFACC03]|uniref:helix-turn-helix domain-containing protein n=1 Tax=Sinorhizobium sp. NFACC03 TaxID=1566295 RepID=UPI000885780A|nr:helix-turn-helix transcriptional regulator [Sinorhizobium sp. NFACC03]SDA62151.1 Helix-turn-helix [Sinorhizobium sp. NFACC03]